MRPLGSNPTPEVTARVGVNGKKNMTDHRHLGDGTGLGLELLKGQDHLEVEG